MLGRVLRVSKTQGLGSECVCFHSEPQSIFTSKMKSERLDNYLLLRSNNHSQRQLPLQNLISGSL